MFALLWVHGENMVCLEIAVRIRCVEVHGKMMLMGVKPVPGKVFKFDLIFTFLIVPHMASSDWTQGNIFVQREAEQIYAKMQINSVSKYLIPAIGDILKKLVFPLVGHYRQISVDVFAWVMQIQCFCCLWCSFKVQFNKRKNRENKSNF